MPILLKYVPNCLPHWGQTIEVSLEDDGNDFLISLAPFTHVAEARSFPKGCPGKLSTYSNDVAGTRRAWNSSLGLLVRPFCKFF